MIFSVPLRTSFKAPYKVFPVSESTWVPRKLLIGMNAVNLVMAISFLLGFYSLAGAAVRYVDQANSQCSDSGQGTQQVPYCTISAAAAVAQAGDSVVVSSGNYNERVIVASSGGESAPIVFTAADGATVKIYGKENGFRISSRNWITIQGFEISDTTSYGIYVKYSTHIRIYKNHVTKSGLPIANLNYYGIFLSSTADSLVSGNTVDYNTDSGIYLSNGSTRNTILGNYTSYNAQVFSRAAPGIDIRGPGNTIKNNISHHNEDSGIQVRGGGSDNLIVNNLCYQNGDHGIDCLDVPRQRIIGNTIFGNVTSGINIEGTSPNCIVANNITVDNGIRSPRKDGNININATSIPGTLIDYDLMFLREPWIMVVWGSTDYRSLAEFVAATGMEVHGLEADPRWVAQQTGDFHLTAVSPAIDSADSGVSGAEGADIESNPRVDDPSVPNTGAGPRTYDDRGAYEYQITGPPDTEPPTVNITAPDNGATISGTVAVTANAADNVAVVGVQFKLNGSNLGGEDLSAPYSIDWDSSTVSNGAYRLTAVARDASGNSTESAAVNVTVSNPSMDTIPPTVSITAPSQGATVSGTVIVTADASDNVGVVGVRFKLDGDNLGEEDITAPYSVTWNTLGVGDGSHALTAVARDAAGNTTESSAVPVTVNNASSTTLTFVAIEDATISLANPDTNYGSSTSLEVDNSPKKDFLIKFSVSGVDSRTVTSAKVRLHCTNGSDRGGDFFQVYVNSWSEGSVTWNTAPANYPVALGSLGAVSSGTWVEVGVTPLVTGDGLVSSRISTTSTNGADYSSRETANYKPQLIVTVQ